MPRKTPAHVVKMLERYEEKMLHFEEILRIKSTFPVENQAAHVRDNSFEYYDGVIRGTISATEDMLHTFGCYHGFYYVNALRESLVYVSGRKIQDDPEYRDWRIKFYTK